MKHRVRIGISGWTYIPWRGTFYPKGVTQRLELNFASRQVNSIEINGAFYALQRPPTFSKWYDAVPADFIFSVKAHRFITHIKKLNDVKEPLANFFASGILKLEDKLGPVLWQFPPNMKFHPEQFADFLRLLPHDWKMARRLALRHGGKVKGRAFIPSPKAKNRQIRHAVEVRHETFNDPVFTKLLKRHNVALVTADSGGKWPYFEAMTADFAYVRLHGNAELYASGYTKASLDQWAAKIKRWRRTRDVYVYFDNDIKVHAPYDAVALMQKIEVSYQPAVPMDPKNVKELRTPGPRMVSTDSRWANRTKKATKKSKND